MSRGSEEMPLFGKLEYHRDKMVATWTADVEFACVGMSEEQRNEALRIIEANNHGGMAIIGILNALAKAGFKGEVQNRTVLGLPTRVLLKAKIQTT